MGKAKRPRLDPDDVIEGRARPGAREILALIHEVNPSGHELPARERARRYAQKSRLQSLLIRRHPDEIAVEPGGEEGVVGLRHRSSGADACHAVIASLDDDARSWVQRELDLGGEEAPPSSVTPVSEPVSSAPASDAPLDELSTDDLLRRGRAAREAYDYEAARGAFAAALDRGRAEAGPLLLALLVDGLGLDEDALGLEARLDKRTLALPEVRLRLALAAARVGARARAERHVGDAVGDAAADVFVALAQGALGHSELDLAARDLAEAQRRAPSHPALQGLAEAVRRRRAEERAPLEAEAQRLFDEGRAAEAEARAEEVLARWPESVPARAIVRAGEERRRGEQARALAAEGKAALAQGESARALGLLRRALGLGLSGDEAAALEADVAAAESEERSREERDRCALIATWLREGHTLRGLTEYAGLSLARRHEVKSRIQLQELAYIDQIGVVEPGPDAKGAAQAVMALVRAIAAMRGKDWKRADDLIAGNWRFLQEIPDAARAYELSQSHAALERRILADRRLIAGMEAFHGGKRENLVKALRIFESVKKEDLDEKGQRTHLEVTVRTRRMLERWDRAQHIAKLRKKGDLASVLVALEELIRFEQTGPVEDILEDADPNKGIRGYEWPRMRDEALRSLAKSADLRVDEGPAGGALFGQEAPRLHDVPASILPGGREVVLAEFQGRYGFLQAVDTTTGRVERRATMRLRDELEVQRVQHHGGRLCMLGPKGAYLALDPSDWVMRRAISFALTEKATHHEEDTALSPGGRFLWQSRSIDGWWSVVAVDDVAVAEVSQRKWREINPRVTVQPLLGAEPPRVLVVCDGILTQYEAKGTRIHGTQHPLPALHRGVVVHPSGAGLFALIRDELTPDQAPDEPEPQRVHRVRWAEVGASGAPLPVPAGDERILPGLDPDGPHQVATALEARMVFVLYSTPAGARHLVGLRARDAAGAGPGVEQRFAVEVPARVTLAQDGDAKTVVALSPHEGGIEVVRLGDAPPVFRAAPPSAAPFEPDDLLPTRPCAPLEVPLWSARSKNTPYTVGFSMMLGGTPEARRPIFERVLDHRELLVPRHAALLRFPLPTLADELAALVLPRYAGEPEALQITAQRAAHAGRWGEARDALAGLDPSGLGDAAAQHHDHLLGLALLMLGEVDEARRVLLRGAARAGSCDLSAPLALVGASAPSPGLRRRSVHDGVLALHAAARAADGRLALGDACGARRALAGLVVREAREVQTLARLARAWLAEPEGAEGPEVDAFARRYALAAFLRAHAEKRPTLRRELPLPGARWDGATLDALAAEVTRWLDEEARANGAPP